MSIVLDLTKSTCPEFTNLTRKDFNGERVEINKWTELIVDITVPDQCPIGTVHQLVY